MELGTLTDDNLALLRASEDVSRTRDTQMVCVTRRLLGPQRFVFFPNFELFWSDLRSVFWFSGIFVVTTETRGVKMIHSGIEIIPKFDLEVDF